MDQVKDFAQFLNYKTIDVPVQCGSKNGKIYTFSHQDHLKNSLLKDYREELQGLIEKKKYLDSVKSRYDIGPTIAVANLVEDGEYAEFVKKHNHDDLKLTGLEHVIRVEEFFKGDNTSHLILPLDEDQDFINKEQLALMRYSIYFKKLTDPTKDLNQGAKEWVLENKNAEVFRNEVLKSSRVYQIEGCSRVYSNCAIYKNLFREIIKRYAIGEKECEETHETKERMGVFYNSIHV